MCFTDFFFFFPSPVTFWCRDVFSHLVSSSVHGTHCILNTTIPYSVHNFDLPRFFFERDFFFFSLDAPTEPIYDKNAKKVNNTIYFHYFLRVATILHNFYSTLLHFTFYIECRQNVKPFIAIQCKRMRTWDNANDVSHSTVKTNDVNRAHGCRVKIKTTDDATMRCYRVTGTIGTDKEKWNGDDFVHHIIQFGQNTKY